jgi:hypothetical protein
MKMNPFHILNRLSFLMVELINTTIFMFLNFFHSCSQHGSCNEKFSNHLGALHTIVIRLRGPWTNSS